MSEEFIIAYADKSVLKISGLNIKGMSTTEVEDLLSDKLKAFVRVIGVTGSSIEMDVYDIDPEQVRKNADGVIDTIALAEGISVSDVTSLSCSDRIVPVDFNNIPDEPISDCPMERWIKRG
jgi:hypothetical protein